MIVTMGWENTGTPWASVADLVAQMALERENFNAVMVPCYLGYSYLGINFVGNVGGNEYSGQSLKTTPVVGGSSGEPVPQNCAALVKKAVVGPTGTRSGRLYLPGVVREAQVSATGVITSGEVTSIQTAVNNWITASATDGLEPNVFHEPTGLNPTPAPSFVSQLQVQTILATQRRRMRR
jgi:hypothetical protein